MNAISVTTMRGDITTSLSVRCLLSEPAEGHVCINGLLNLDLKPPFHNSWVGIVSLSLSNICMPNYSITHTVTSVASGKQVPHIVFTMCNYSFVHPSFPSSHTVSRWCPWMPMSHSPRCSTLPRTWCTGARPWPSIPSPRATCTSPAPWLTPECEHH